jgi:hypothetical protein
MTLFSSLWSEANGTNTPLFGDLWEDVSDTGVDALEPLFANGELGGYWPADPAYAFEDSAGTIAASVNGVVGYRTDVVLGKHAVQATTANKPYLRRTPTTGKYWYDSNTETGALTATFSGALGSACTIATVTPEGVSILENQTVGSTYNITPPYGYNGPVLVIDRALTPPEIAMVTRVMARDVPALSSELLSDPEFDTGVGWTGVSAITPNWVVSGGNAAVPSIAYASSINNNAVLVVGKTYQFKCNVTSLSGSLVYFGAIGYPPPHYTAGNFTKTNIATSTLFRVFAAANTAATVSSVSAKEIY